MSADNAQRRVMYPVMFDLAGRPALVVGAGAVAGRRVAGLLEAGAVVTVVAPQAGEVVRAAAEAGRVAWLERPFGVEDVTGMALVLTATRDPGVDRAVADAARAAGIPVNAADDDDNCDFHLPAVARRGLITIAVGTGGAAPTLAARLRDRFASWLGSDWVAFADLLAEARSLARARFSAPADRMAALKRAAHDDSARAALARGERVSAEELLERSEHGRAAGGHPHAFVSLVGAGPGAPDLLTVRAYDRLRSADVVLYDDLVDRRVLEAAPSAELVYAGKRGWRQGPVRPGPDALVAHALEGEGRRVVRLKGGDPNVFGKSDEEIEALEHAGVPYEVVPGVTAGMAAAAAAGIPLTKRGVAGSLTIATAVTMGAEDPAEPSAADLASLVRAGNTVVVYMGLRALPRLVTALRAAGVSASLPAAVVGSASLPSERVVTATLEHIEREAEQAEIASPAVVILGEVVSSRLKHNTHATSAITGGSGTYAAASGGLEPR